MESSRGSLNLLVSPLKVTWNYYNLDKYRTFDKDADETDLDVEVLVVRFLISENSILFHKMYFDKLPNTRAPRLK